MLSFNLIFSVEDGYSDLVFNRDGERARPRRRTARERKYSFASPLFTDIRNQTQYLISFRVICSPEYFLPLKQDDISSSFDS